MKEAIKQYGVIIEDVQKDIEEAESFKADLKAKYKAAMDLDEVIKTQSMILKISDLISQKRVQKVELERQKREYEAVLRKEELKGENAF